MTAKKSLISIKRKLKSSSVKRCAKRHNTVGDPSCMKACYLLHKHPDLSVGEVSELIDLSPSATSRCLCKLKDSDIIKGTKQAQTVRYCLKKNNFTRNLINQLEE